MFTDVTVGFMNIARRCDIFDVMLSTGAMEQQRREPRDHLMKKLLKMIISENSPKNFIRPLERFPLPLVFFHSITEPVKNKL